MPLRLQPDGVADPLEQEKVFRALFRPTEGGRDTPRQSNFGSPGSVHTPLATSAGESVEPALRVGRYVVLRLLGRGGMGVVYACYDEQLDRKVAVKLMQGKIGSDSSRQRLEREAQALARLSHPNVVQIYEIGHHFGDPFVAMELVVGRTLRSWLESPHGPEAPVPTWRERLELLCQAGAGLAAAHEAGLVHRDFKPDNVLVGADGRVRVLDFGLVRYVETARADHGIEQEPPRPEDDDVESEAPDEGRGLTVLTKVGAVMGTPAYMAPEQFRALPCNATSDQFSFCVVAFEMLFGTRPFVGTSLATLSIAVLTGASLPVPEGSPVPKLLRDAILRGLRGDPSERWPSMAALLAELDRVRGKTRRPWRMVWALSIASVAVAGFGMHMATQPRLCVFDSQEQAGAWDDEQGVTLRLALANAGLPDTGDAFARIDARLDDWDSRWLDARTRTCEATHVLGTQSEALLDLRNGCLERGRREFKAITGLLLATDGSGVEHLSKLLVGLPDLSVCEDPRLAETTQPLPRDPPRREAILAAYEELGRVRGLGNTGRLDQAEESLDVGIGELGYLPLTLEQQTLTADVELWRGRVEGGVVILRAAIRDAQIAGLDELAATMRTRLAHKVVGSWGNLEVQSMVLDEAETAVAHIGRADDPRAIGLRLDRAFWWELTGDSTAALTGYHEVLEQVRARGDDAMLAATQRQLAQAYARLGRFEPATQALVDAREASERAFGQSQIYDGRIELDLGMLELDRGEFAVAEEHFALARAKLDGLLDARADELMALDLVQGKLANMHGERDRAREAFNRVVELSSDDQRRSDAWEALGAIAFYEGDATKSLDCYRRARNYRLATRGPTHTSVGMLDSNIGESQALAGDHLGALATFEAAFAVLETALPPDHIELSFPLKGRGKSRFALGEFAAARIDLEAALRIHAANPSEPLEHADVEYMLARVLIEQDESVRALELATAARQRYADYGHPEEAAEITNWIAHEERRNDQANVHSDQRHSLPPVASHGE